MRYEEFYKKQEEKYIKIRKQIKLIPLYSVLVGILLAVFLFLFFMSGTPTKTQLVTIQYGESVDAPESFMGTSHYEYLVNEEWQEELPAKPGSYECRVVSKGMFGRTVIRNINNLTIEPRLVTVECIIREIEYGKTPSASADLMPGDKLESCSFYYKDLSQSFTNVWVNKSSIVIKNDKGVDVTEYYQFETPQTKIFFTSIPLVISIGSASKVYDGTPLTCSDYEIDGDLINGDTITVTTTGSQTVVGTSPNTATNRTVRVVSASGKVVDNYDLLILPGTLTVTQKPISVFTTGDEFSFDGETHSYDTLEVDRVIKDTVVVSSSVDVLAVGEYEYKLEYDIVNAKGVSVKNCYDIDESFGMIYCRKSIARVAINPLTVDYSNTTIYDVDYTVKMGSLFGSTLSIQAKTEDISVGAHDLVVDSYSLSIDGVDVKESIIIDFVKSTITINPLEITLKPKDNTKEYDGVSYNTSIVDVVEGSLLSSDKLEASAESSGIEIGTHPISVLSSSVQIKNGTKDVTSNYKISYENAELTIQKRKLTISPSFKDITYGDPVVEDYSVKENQLLFGDSITNVVYSYDAIFGTNAVSISSIDIVNSLGNRKDYYDIEYKESSYKINPIEITIAMNSKSKTYDGIELSYSAEEKPYLYHCVLLDGHTISYAPVDLSITMVGVKETSLTTGSIEIMDEDCNSVKEYYSITFIQGKLEVKAKMLYIISGSKTEVYEDGVELTCNEYTVVGLFAGHSISEEYSFIVGSLKDVGEASNTIDLKRVVIVDEYGEDVTSYYSLVAYEGTLTYVERSGD